MTTRTPTTPTPPNSTPPTTRQLLNTQPYPYQLQGALNAVKGKTLIADEPGLGKTLQAILYTGLIKARKVIIICPPSLITNWTNEITNSQILTTPTYANIQMEILPIYAATKNPTPPSQGIIIISDTLITARPKLANQLAEWKTDLVILDEAHRIKNPRAKRTKAILALAKTTTHTLALTGTPIVSNPLDVLPILRFLKKTSHYPANYVERYTQTNHWGGRDPRLDHLPELHHLLETTTWTRRTKQQVLKDLPDKTRHTQWVDIDPTPVQETLQPLIDDVHAIKAATPPNKLNAALDEWAQDQALRKASALRRATGLAKIPAAVEWAQNHHEGTHRPLLIWAIHTDVIQGITHGLTKTLPATRIATYTGKTPQTERNTITQDFQAGRIDFLICQIIAAGTGLTLTRASEALFAETDWTPANVVQAEDRIHRISQDQPVTITTLIAPDTLDPIIHKVLTRNIRTLDILTPGSDHHVTSTNTKTSISQILTQWAKQQLQKGNPDE